MLRVPWQTILFALLLCTIPVFAENAPVPSDFIFGIPNHYEECAYPFVRIPIGDCGLHISIPEHWAETPDETTLLTCGTESLTLTVSRREGDYDTLFHEEKQKLAQGHLRMLEPMYINDTFFLLGMKSDGTSRFAVLIYDEAQLLVFHFNGDISESFEMQILGSISFT